MSAQPRSNDVVFLVAGEPSGDALGARLMAALKRATDGRVRFAGVGGERMEAEGLKSIFPLTDIAVMGFTEVIPRLPTLLRRISETTSAVRRLSPSVVVTIDAPSFGLRVADRVRGDGVPLVHYVAPQLWAWRPGRARKLAHRVDHLLALLPFEPEFFRGLGVACSYVGHPVLEDALQPVSGPAFRSKFGIGNSTPLVVMMPGSRIGLVGRMLPVFMAAMERLAARIPGLRVVLPVVAGTETAVRQAVSAWAVPHTIVTTIEDKHGAYAAANAALTVSGTATMELAVANVPMVVGYRVNRLTELIARQVIEVAHVAMPNLILGRAAVPELLQSDCTPDRLAGEMERLITGQGATQQRQDLVEICRRLGLDEMRATGVLPSDRAARAVLDAIARDRDRH